VSILRFVLFMKLLPREAIGHGEYCFHNKIVNLLKMLADILLLGKCVNTEFELRVFHETSYTRLPFAVLVCRLWNAVQ
jgi:hypothetical protein